MRDVHNAMNSIPVSQNKQILSYSIGGLLYAPALNKTIAQKIVSGSIPCLSAVAFCLEDTIEEEALPLAEAQLRTTLADIGYGLPEREARPLLFARIRSPHHMAALYQSLGTAADVLTGFILPKFDLSNAAAYTTLITEINAGRKTPLYVMPILESAEIAYRETRLESLTALRHILDSCARYVLNIRVGGNDFCNLFGLRRTMQQTIYDISLLRDIFTDIINIFGRDYVVSGPVWEYFDGGNGDTGWRDGLVRELALDRLNGFIGKTAIHPSQLPAIRDSLMVSQRDYDDAMQILHWQNGGLAVAKSGGDARMNERKVHENWARKTVTLAEIYGVRPDCVQPDSAPLDPIVNINSALILNSEDAFSKHISKHLRTEDSHAAQ